MSVFNPTVCTHQPSHYCSLSPPALHSKVNTSSHPLHTRAVSCPAICCLSLLDFDFSAMPSVKQSSSSSSYSSCAARLARQALVYLAHALVASGRLSYAELLSPNSVSDVTTVVRQVRELLRVGHTQWRQLAEEAAESHPDNGEMEQSSESSASSSHSSAAAEVNSPLSASSLPHSPASPVSSHRSESPPNPRRTLTIVTRSNGKRPRPSPARRQSTAITSNSTTYMTADEFTQYFRRCRSLSEAVKRITKDYPSYREVSIYARARRLQCRFDGKGRFYQPNKKAGTKQAAGFADDSTSNTHCDGEASQDESEEEELGDEQRGQHRKDQARSGSIHRHRSRHGRHRKARKIEWEVAAEHDSDEDDEDDDSSSGDNNDMQSVSSYMSSSSDSSSSSSSSSTSEVDEPSTAVTAMDATQLPVGEASPAGMNPLQLLAASAGLSAFTSLPAGKSNKLSKPTAAINARNRSTKLALSKAAEKRANGTATVRSLMVTAPSLAVHPANGAPLTQRPSHASLSPAPRLTQALSGGAFMSSLAVRSSAVLSPVSGAYGQHPMSPAMLPVFGSPYALPTRVLPYQPSPFNSATALTSMPLWPPRSALPVSPAAAAAASHASGLTHGASHSLQRISLASMASPTSVATEVATAAAQLM